MLTKNKMQKITEDFFIVPGKERDILLGKARIYSGLYRGTNMKYRTICKLERPLINKKMYVFLDGYGMEDVDAKRYANKFDVEKEVLLFIDAAFRQELVVKTYEMADLKISKAGFLGKILFFWKHPNPLFQFGIRVSFLSLFLGVIGLILGFISIIS